MNKRPPPTEQEASRLALNPRDMTRHYVIHRIKKCDWYESKLGDNLKALLP